MNEQQKISKIMPQIGLFSSMTRKIAKEELESTVEEQ
jgi:hypothetical protein